MSLPADIEIVKSLRQSDQVMFETLFRHYYNALCRFATGILKDPDEAEETVQQVMVTVWEKRMTLEIHSSLKSYLYRAVHNGALNRIRKLKSTDTLSDDHGAGSVRSAESASHKVLVSELKGKISEAISRLPDQCRLVFQLSRFEGMKYAEIAAHLGISEKTVENHMGKALKLMRLYLKDYLVWIIIFMPSLL